VPVYVSLLRAVNVGGRTIPMADLRALYEELGHHDVVTYLQSGNVISRSTARRAAAVERAVSTAISVAFGMDVDVLVRTPKQMQAVRDGNPFLRRRGEKPPAKALHVTFLATVPEAKRVRDLDETAFTPDELRVVAREVYLWCPNGYGRTKLTNAWFERKLGVRTTTRNWTKVAKLAELSDAQASALRA
jgi:uncharacterized protein (DUF1697 family)